MVAELPTRRRPLSPPSAIDALTPDENEDDKIQLNPEAVEKFEEAVPFIMSGLACIGGVAAAAGTGGAAAGAAVASCSMIVGQVFEKGQKPRIEQKRLYSLRSLWASSHMTCVSGAVPAVCGSLIKETVPAFVVAKPPKFVPDLKWAKAYVEEIKLIVSKELQATDAADEAQTQAVVNEIVAAQSKSTVKVQRDVPIAAVTSATGAPTRGLDAQTTIPSR